MSSMYLENDLVSCAGRFPPQWFWGGPRQDKQEQQEQESQKRREQDKLAQNHRQ